jgi:uncharacterized protein (UPF0276 family)
MLLAINYSTQAASLVKEKRIQLDRFKCPDWPEMIAEASQIRPVAVHFTLAAGRGKLYKTDWKLVEHLLVETDTPYVNLHLEPHVNDFPGIDPDDPAQDEPVIEQMVADIRLAAQRFGPERVIVENVPYRGRGYKVLRPAVLPEVITQMLGATGCNLLLDISHARIAAHSLEMDEREYMSRLPVQRLCELHFTGLHNLDGQLQDHLEILDTDWPVLDWVLDQIRTGEWKKPWMLAFEYGGVGEKFAWRSNPQVIAAQAPQLYERIRDI